MAYISNPVYYGVGAVDAPDRDAALLRSAYFDTRFSQAYAALSKLPPQQLAQALTQVQAAVQSLAPEQRKQVETVAASVVGNDPRKVHGLGDALSAIANGAAAIAAIGSLTLGVYGFMEQKKATKANQAAQDKAQKLAEKQANADIKLQKQALAATTKQNAVEAKQEAAASKKKTSGLATAGGVTAAVVGAFLLTK